jgi:hypothetical protein
MRDMPAVRSLRDEAEDARVASLHGASALMIAYRRQIGALSPGINAYAFGLVRVCEADSATHARPSLGTGGRR